MICRDSLDAAGSSAQQYPRHWCVINTFLATTAEHSTMRAAMETNTTLEK